MFVGFRFFLEWGVFFDIGLVELISDVFICLFFFIGIVWDLRYVILKIKFKKKKERIKEK